MSKEVDDFLFPSAPSTPAAQQAAPAMQVAPLAPQAVPAKKAEAAPPPAAPKAPAAIAPPAINPRSVAMPSMEEIVPQITAAASAAKAAAPKPTVASPISALIDEVSQNWKPLALGAATVIAAQVARSALSNRSVRNAPPGGTGGGNMPPANAPGPLGPLGPETPAAATTGGPLFATPEETAAQEIEVRNRNAQAQQRLDEFEKLWAARNASNTVIPPAAEPPVLTQEVPAIAEEAPKTAAAIATEQPGSKVAEAVVKDELAIPAAAQLPAEAGTEPEKTVPGRTRRNKAQIEQDLANAFAQAPPGMRPAAPRKTNKLPGDVVGQGGWHFFAGQGGQPEDWLRLYGRNPQPYNRVVSDIKGGLLPVPPAPAGAMGGDIPRQAYVPEFIRGRASPGGLVGLSAIAAALGLAGSEKGREAMGRAAAAIKDIGISPDIFQGKGEELGKLGRGYVAAGNPNYLRELNAQLQNEADPQRRSILMEEIRKAGGQ